MVWAKSHFMCLGQNTANESFVYNYSEAKRRENIKRSIDNKLRLKSHIKNLCEKSSQKIWALSQLINCLNDSEKKLIFNTLI